MIFIIKCLGFVYIYKIINKYFFSQSQDGIVIRELDLDLTIQTQVSAQPWSDLGSVTMIQPHLPHGVVMKMKWGEELCTLPQAPWRKHSWQMWKINNLWNSLPQDAVMTPLFPLTCAAIWLCSSKSAKAELGTPGSRLMIHDIITVHLRMPQRCCAASKGIHAAEQFP